MTWLTWLQIASVPGGILLHLWLAFRLFNYDVPDKVAEVINLVGAAAVVLFPVCLVAAVMSI
jgi:hypothetical protein